MYPCLGDTFKGEVQWKTILQGIIDGIIESHVVPSVLQLEPCSQRKQPLKTGLDKVSIRGIQLQANLSTTVDGLQSQLQFLLLGQDTGASNFTRDMILALRAMDNCCKR